jgi:pimeloyl-ACP methyl ester carboxylesterase
MIAHASVRRYDRALGACTEHDGSDQQHALVHESGMNDDCVSFRLPSTHRSIPGATHLAQVWELLEAEILARGILGLDIVGHSAGAYRAFSLAPSD